MAEAAYTKEDLALFVDLERATRAVDLEPCLIGAGAIQLGIDTRWRARLTRLTRDWDFAIRIDSWDEYEALAVELCSQRGRFRRGAEPHRFVHEEGSVLDVVPYGDVELHSGHLQWPGGTVMNTTGFSALERHYEVGDLGAVALRAATLPAVVGLKFIAYLDRRPGIVRDIQDVYHLLREAEHCVSEERIVTEAMRRLSSEEIGYGESGAYLLGRDVGATFQEAALAPILELLAGVAEEKGAVVSDVLRSTDVAGLARASVTERLSAFRLGVLDR